MHLGIDLDVRDLQQTDLDALEWSGGAAHRRTLGGVVEATWRGDAEAVVAELPTGVVVAMGALDLARSTDWAWLWLLAVRPDWQRLGLGTALVGVLEARAAASGLPAVRLAAEHDNPGAASLYRRLGYRQVGSTVESWPDDAGRRYVTVSSVFERRLGAPDQHQGG
ncbi:MAG TPA: GNAT family N-acetyltransferase [Propionibacteriaceae bacterium]|nr:GNAT family N-acetyltransferase [Propionibacteriaceae bacterium]